ncbi:MAG: adenylyl-sulfate kinase [Azospirillaceae bacterium]
MPEPHGQPRAPLRIVVVGHVDHGKSTLIGRLLYDTDSLPEGKFEELQRVSERRGMPLEWSFVLDAFQAERDQAVTIDTTQIWFRSRERDYVIIDAPGHREFLRNMVSGAANAEAAVLVVDAAEGVREQTRRHAYLLHMLGLRQILVVVNKMDAVDHSDRRFAEVKREVERYLEDIGLSPNAVIPISAREGDNLARPSSRMLWYEGETVVDSLDRFRPLAAPIERPLRFPVQDVYKFDERRIVAGRIESGILRVGDEILVSPANRAARIKSIEAWNSAVQQVEARAGQSIGITLEDQLFIERGDVISHIQDASKLSHVFRTTLFWLGTKPLEVGNRYTLKLATRMTPVTVEKIETVIDTQSLGSTTGEAVQRDEVAEVILRARETLSIDEHRDNPAMGRAVLLDRYDTVGGGVVDMRGYPDLRQGSEVRSTNVSAVEHLLTTEARAARNGHDGAVVWLTGLSGAGKSTLAMHLERRLFDKGYHVYVLDGDNVRRGLNADLGFGPDERAENIRRVGEVAALFADAGTIVITSFISPYREDRNRARAAAPGRFHEVYVAADLAVCETRDPKGLYRKARAGEIKDFTGISSPYEEPDNADLVVDTSHQSVESCVDSLVAYVERHVRLERATVRAVGD